MSSTLVIKQLYLDSWCWDLVLKACSPSLDHLNNRWWLWTCLVLQLTCTVYLLHMSKETHSQYRPSIIFMYVSNMTYRAWWSGMGNYSCSKANNIRFLVAIDIFIYFSCRYFTNKKGNLCSALYCTFKMLQYKKILLYESLIAFLTH